MQQSTIVRSTRTSRIGTIAAVLLVGLLTSVPWWSSPASMRLITEFLVYLALASMWNLLAGYAGLLSIGQHAYVGFGGYAMFSCALFLGIGPLYAIPIAGAAAALKRAARGPVKIGWWGSLTGAFALNGIQQRDGFRFFIGDRKGYLAGHRINVVYEDDGSSPATALERMTPWR